MSSSRFKVWRICSSPSQTHLFDFLANAFETLGGAPSEILIDNASTMMDKARTERSDGKMMGLTFKGQEQEDVKKYAQKHFEELEKFNEQLSTVTTKSI